MKSAILKLNSYEQEKPGATKIKTSINKKIYDSYYRGFVQSSSEVWKVCRFICFSDVDAGEQMRRIRLRNGEERAQMFAEKWRPMEERYLVGFDVRKRENKIV